MMQPPVSANSPFRLHELGEYSFQDLCRDLFDVEREIAGCEVYGVRGQSQYGIDLIAYRVDVNEIEVGQCKCYRTYSAGKIKKASDDFFEHSGRWSEAGVKRFILFVACDLTDTACQDQILKERKRFAESGIAYEAWSSAKIKNKLRPYPDIVKRYFTTHSEYWVSVICGVVSPAFSSVIETTPQTSLVVAAAFAQNERLAARLSTDMEKQAEENREAWREGRRKEAVQWVSDLKSDSSIWMALDGNVRAKILRFEASLVLDETHDLERAKSLADEAHTLAPADDQSRVRALIAYREAGPKEALAMLIDKEDIDSLNLRAAFLLELGTIDQSRALLETAKSSSQAVAETFRLRALSYILTKEMGQARLEIQKALEKAPAWKSIRVAAGMIGYLSSLSPAAIPKAIVQWPEPVDWSLVKRDDESLSRLRESETIFRELADTADDQSELQIFESWRLACLANDPDSQEEASRYCRGILGRNRTHYQAIAWALVRKLDIRFGPSEKKLTKLCREQKAEVPHILALAGIFLASGVRRSKKAISLLEDSKPIFESLGAHELWLFWLSHAYVVNRDPLAAISTLDNQGPCLELRHSKTMALCKIAHESGDWQSLLVHLEASYKETKDGAFLLEACELMAYRHEWAYVADRAEQLVRELQTAAALRLAVISANNSRRFNFCLKLLDENRGFFRGTKLPNDLRRMRANCCQALGILPEAIAEAEALARDEPTTEHLIDLAHHYSTIGDLKSLAIVARRLLGRVDIDPEKALKIAYLVQWEDLELSRAFWKLGIQLGISDDLVSIALSLGYQFGLDEEAGTLLARMNQLGRKGKGGIQMATMEDLVAFAKQQREHSEMLSKIYREGTAPIHLIASQANRPLVDIYHFCAQRNEAALDPTRQYPILIRHGGRQLSEEFPGMVSKTRVCMDITAVLLSMHLGILDDVERSFRQVAIPADMIPALIHMREKVSHHQPKRLEAYNQVVHLVESGSAVIIEPRMLLELQETVLLKEVGEDWSALFEYARSNNGYVVDFLPVRRGDLSGQVASLPAYVKEHLIDCRSVAESLRQAGPLSESEYADAINLLGNQPRGTHEIVVPKQGSLLVCHGNIPEVLAGANLLEIACNRFKLAIEKSELEAAKAELEGNRQRVALANWLGSLIDKLSRGIGEGRYEVLPRSPLSDDVAKIPADDIPVFDCLHALLLFNPKEYDIIWSDDRYINSYLRRDNIPIIGINEVLKGLVKAGSLRIDDYYDKVLRLRAANARFIPVEKDEVLYHLRQAAVEDERVIETRSLTVLRRYIAACLNQVDLLQRPPMPQGAPNENGEIAFVLGLLREISDSILGVWADPKEDEALCHARAEWLMDNLYFDHAIAFKALSPPNPVNERYLAAIGLSGLISQAIGLPLFRSTDVASSRRRYFEWLSHRILDKRFDADPDLVVGVAEHLKDIIHDTKETVNKEGHPRLTARLLQAYYEELPSVIKDELARDSSFMAEIGIRLIFTNSIGGLKFLADEFWRAVAEVINGRSAKISTVDSNQLISFFPSDDPNAEGLFYLERPLTGEKEEVKDDLFEILSESPKQREAVLRRNYQWFDCPKDIFESVIAEIATAEDIKQRIDRTLMWRNSSAAIYYEKISRKAVERREFQFTDGLPSVADALLRHFRLQNVVNTGSEFQGCLLQAAENLLRDEGLFEVLTRLSGLPVPLPLLLMDAVSVLPPDEARSLVKRMVRAAGSPISKIHLIRILTHLSDRLPAYQGLARRVTISILNSDGEEEFEAFCTLMKWVSEEFGNWRDTRQWPAQIRLAMVWAHSHQLFTIFRSTGAPASWINETFEKAWRRLPFEMFERDPDYWFDIAHPRQISREGFILTGLAYGMGEAGVSFLDQRLHDSIAALITHEIDGKQVPALALLRDPARARDGIASFLARDRGDALHLLLNEDFRSFHSSALTSILEQALARLAASSDQSFDWALVHAVLGDLPPSSDTIEQLKRALYRADFVSLFEENPLVGMLAVQTASSQAGNTNDEDLRKHLKNELLQIAKLLAGKPEHSERSQGERSIDITRIVMNLLEAALNLSVAVRKTGNVAAEFGGITTEIAELWSAALQEYGPLIQRLCEELPISQANDLWPLLIRLRAG